MKKTIIFLTLFGIASYSFGQISVNPTVKCPPCKPISSCGICWEDQQKADDCQRNRVDDFVESIETKLTVTPNPIRNGNFTVTSSKQIDGNIVIINQVGAIIKEIAPSSEKTNYKTIQLDLESGLYFMIYYDMDKKEKITKKLIFTN